MTRKQRVKVITEFIVSDTREIKEQLDKGVIEKDRTVLGLRLLHNRNLLEKLKNEQ